MNSRRSFALFARTGERTNLRRRTDFRQRRLDQANNACPVAQVGPFSTSSKVESRVPVRSAAART
jgi:hypothetical protein